MNMYLKSTVVRVGEGRKGSGNSHLSSTQSHPIGKHLRRGYTKTADRWWWCSSHSIFVMYQTTNGMDSYLGNVTYWLSANQACVG